MSRESVCAVCSFLEQNQCGARRGPAHWPRRAQIADGVRGPRADASESTRRAECAAPCLSLHVKCLASGLAFCVAAQGHAARRRLSDRYKEVHAAREARTSPASVDALNGGHYWPCPPERRTPCAHNGSSTVAAFPT